MILEFIQLLNNSVSVFVKEAKSWMERKNVLAAWTSLSSSFSVFEDISPTKMFQHCKTRQESKLKLKEYLLAIKKDTNYYLNMMMTPIKGWEATQALKQKWSSALIKIIPKLLNPSKSVLLDLIHISNIVCWILNWMCCYIVTLFSGITLNKHSI